MFHVKHAIASVAKICLHIFMTEHEHVGLEESKHNQGYQAKMCLHIFIWKPKGVGLWLCHSPNIDYFLVYSCREKLSTKKGIAIILKNHPMLRCLLVISKDAPAVT